MALEIVQRFYLTIGFVALLGLVALGSTSTDAAIRRLGSNWGRLHRIVYVIGVLAAFHFFIQSKADVYRADADGRVVRPADALPLGALARLRPVVALVLVGLACFAGLATAGIEYAWYGLATGIPPGRVLAANLQFAFSIRPSWWVLAVGLAAAFVAFARPYFGKRRQRSGRPARCAGGCLSPG